MRNIKLLLTENIDNLGIVGDVVEVKPGYARNYLLPRSMAIAPTPGAIKRLAARRAEVEKELKLHREAMVALLEKIKDREVTMQRSANEQGVLFGGVSQHDIAQALQAEGFMVEDRMVRIGQQIKRLDTYQIPIVLAADLKTEIKLWVVSDKPAEQLETEKEEKAEAAVEEEKPKRKSKAKAEPEAAAEAAPVVEEEKPKRKGKKKADDAEKA
ncbi:MAG: 50S ribosomal protein L9 [Planctomycetes bacterium]|nr:50S ribosomal protein L9 [Planctomycetota bacterium]